MAKKKLGTLPRQSRGTTFGDLPKPRSVQNSALPIFLLTSSSASSSFFTALLDKSSRTMNYSAEMDKSAGYNVDPELEYHDETLLGEKTGTVADKRDMARLGKEQLFKVGPSSDDRHKEA